MEDLDTYPLAIVVCLCFCICGITRLPKTTNPRSYPNSFCVQTWVATYVNVGEQNNRKAPEQYIPAV